MVKVVAAIIVKKDKILIARRAAHKAMAGKWEFPGGKIEDGETMPEALEREILEEFSVYVKADRFLATNTFSYETFQIELHAFYVTHIQGEFMLSDHDKIAWVTPDELEVYDLAEADIPLVKLLQLKK